MILANPLEPGKEPDVFDDVFTKPQLKAVLVDKINSFTEVKNKIKEFIELFEDLVNRQFADKERQRKENQAKEYKIKIAKVIKVLKRGQIYTKQEEIRDYGGPYGGANEDNKSTVSGGVSRRNN